MVAANIILAITTFLALALGLFIVVSNPRKQINQALSFYIFSIFLWMLANLLTNISADPATSLLFARSTLIGAALLPYAFLVFTQIYISGGIKTRQLVAWGIIPVILLASVPTSLNIVSIEAYGANTKAGSIYGLLVIELLFYFAYGSFKLYRDYRKPSTDSTKKLQIRYMFAGILFAAVPGIIANGILPAVGVSDAVYFGPSIVLILAITTSVAIVKHRLLNIRLLVARSVTYIFTLGTVTLLYSVVVFGLFSQFLGTSSLPMWQQYLYVALAILLAFTFQPLKRFFDKLTNKLFYRDAYEPQELLDSLNKILVSTIELDTLMHSVAGVIATTLKTEFCMLSIKNNEGKEDRIAGTIAAAQVDHHKASIVAAQLASNHQKLITTDELADSHSPLKDSLRQNNIAIVVQLRQSASKQSTNFGYLVLGDKKSGNPFSAQDIRIIEIIADELVIAIQNALRFEEIQQFAATLQEKVDEATHKLRRTNEKLRQLDETKDDFISMASHQLRTPLTSVKGYVSMVLDGDVGKVSAQQKKLLDQAFISSQRMVYLIADLLNVSRLKTGKFVIEPKPTNLAEVVESEMQQLKETAKGRGLKLEYQQPKSFPTLNLDETKIRQVIMNFSDNAIYYTPTGGTIKVNLIDKPEHIEFTVVDNGIGVPKAEQHHLFNKFYRAGNAKKARPDGTGLGLFMAQKVIVAQGGAIIFHSEENKGSTFGFSFPKAKLLVK